MKTLIKFAPVVAVAGQVIGGNTGATVGGAAAGAVVGAATTPRRPH